MSQAYAGHRTRFDHGSGCEFVTAPVARWLAARCRCAPYCDETSGQPGARQRRRSRLLLPAGEGWCGSGSLAWVAGGRGVCAGQRAAVAGPGECDLVAEPGQGLLVVADEVV